MLPSGVASRWGTLFRQRASVASLVVIVTGCGRVARDDQGQDPPADECERSLGVDCDAFKDAFIKPENAAAYDTFGHSASLFEDHLAVGAPGEASCSIGVDSDPSDNGCPDAGAAYVFMDGDRDWSEEAYVKPSHIAEGDAFGEALTLSGATLAVASTGEDWCGAPPPGKTAQLCEDAGAVFVFHRGEETWSEEAYLKASNVEPKDEYGDSVSISGNTLVVSAILEQSCATGVDGDQTSNDCFSAGAVYVYRRRQVAGAVSWEQEAYLKASNTSAKDQYAYFGRSVSLSGDTLAVGADYEDGCGVGVDGDQADSTCADAGAVYVFRRTEEAASAVWEQEAYLKPSNTDAGDHFGAALALDGDTLVVGAPLEQSCAKDVDGDGTDNACEKAGAAYVFERTLVDGNRQWRQQAYIKASNTDAQSNAFGGAVSLSGSALVLGAHAEDGCGTDLNANGSDNGCDGAGAVYLFRREAQAQWVQQAYIKSSNPKGRPPGAFGDALSLSGGSLAIGAPLEDSCSAVIDEGEADSDCQAAGAVYVRRIAP